jgi:uncharacterized phage protein (TIGR02216 family)
MSGVDWPTLMQMGLGGLRLRPHEFWNLTPIEFLLLSGITADSASTTREALEQLSLQYPDRGKSR